MTIENLVAFTDSLPDWSMLSGCFGSTIAPSDIDGFVERNGKCLFLEHKRPGAVVKNGQLRAFRTLVRQGNTVVVFWSGRPDGTDTESMCVMGASWWPIDRAPATLYDLRLVASRWYEEASA